MRTRSPVHRSRLLVAVAFFVVLVCGSLPGTASADDVPALLDRVSGLVDRAIESSSGGKDALIAPSSGALTAHAHEGHAD